MMSGAGQIGGMSRAIDIWSAGLFAGAAGYSAVLLIGVPVAGLAAATAFRSGLRMPIPIHTGPPLKSGGPPITFTAA